MLLLGAETGSLPRVRKYRLDLDGNSVTIDDLLLSHADKDHVEGLIPLLNHPKVTVKALHHNGIGLFDSGFNTPIVSM